MPYGGEGVKVYLQPGTYTFEEISITGNTGNTQSINEYVINKEDTRTIYQVTEKSYRGGKPDNHFSECKAAGEC